MIGLSDGERDAGSEVARPKVCDYVTASPPFPPPSSPFVSLGLGDFRVCWHFEDAAIVNFCSLADFSFLESTQLLRNYPHNRPLKTAKYTPPV